MQGIWFDPDGTISVETVSYPAIKTWRGPLGLGCFASLELLTVAVLDEINCLPDYLKRS